MATSLMCPACDDPVASGDAFCEACGHRLDGPITAGDRCTWCRATVTEGYCDQCGMRQRTERDHSAIEVAGAAGVTDRGLRYSRNEDSQAVVACASPPGGVAVVVSDGVSASPQPDEASDAAARTGAQTLAAEVAAGTPPEEATRRALERAAAAVSALAESEAHAPACTYVSALVPAGDGATVTLGWVGDSRAYWIPADPEATPPTLLTRDDSWSEYMVSSGRLTAEEAMASRNAHALIAWLGADAGPTDAHLRRFTPAGRGAVVLCSDGLWNYLPEADQLAQAIPEAATRPLSSAQKAVRVALEGGGHDNITVVIVPFPMTPRDQEGVP